MRDRTDTFWTQRLLKQHSLRSLLETLRRSLGHTKMSATLEIYTLPVAQAQRQAAENLSGMVTSWLNSGRSCRWLLSGFNEINGRHVGTRTPDLYRVKVSRFVTSTTYGVFS